MGGPVATFSKHVIPYNNSLELEEPAEELINDGRTE